MTVHTHTRATLGALVLTTCFVGCVPEGWTRAAESATNTNTIGWPRYQGTLPPPATAGSASIDPRDVVLLFPKIDQQHVLHWNLFENFRVVLPAGPAPVLAMLPPRSPVGDLRTNDRALSDREYADLRCGFERTWDGPQYTPKTFMVPAFCDGRDLAQSRATTLAIIDENVDDLRFAAVKSHANVVSDIRCYVARDRTRLWCEGRAELAAPREHE